MNSTDEKFEKIVDSMYPRLYSFLMKLTRNSQDAADLTQEVFLRAFKVRDRRRADLAPEGWFFQIAYRCFLDSKRTQRRRIQTVSTEALTHENYAFDPMDPAPNPEQTMMSNKFSEPMMRALDSLTVEQRELIGLAHFGDMTHQELANIYGCGTTTVKTRIHRANVSLRKHLQAFGFDMTGMTKAGAA